MEIYLCFSVWAMEPPPTNPSNPHPPSPTPADPTPATAPETEYTPGQLSSLPHTLSPFAKPFLPGGAQGLTKELRWMNSPASEAESATPPRRSYRDAVKEIAVSPEPEPATTPSHRVQATEPKTEAR